MGTWVWEKYIFITTFMEHIHFSLFNSDIPDMRFDCIRLTIISHQFCVLVILRQEIFPKEKGK